MVGRFLLWGVVCWVLARPVWCADNALPLYVQIEDEGSRSLPVRAVLNRREEGGYQLEFSYDGKQVAVDVGYGEPEMLGLIGNDYFRRPQPLVGVETPAGTRHFGEVQGLVYRARPKDGSWEVDRPFNPKERELLVRAPGAFRSPRTVRVGELSTLMSLSDRRTIPTTLSNGTPVRIVNWTRDDRTGQIQAVVADDRPALSAKPPPAAPKANPFKVFSGKPPPAPAAAVVPEPEPTARRAEYYLVPSDQVRPMTADEYESARENYAGPQALRPKEPFRNLTKVEVDVDESGQVTAVRVPKADAEELDALPNRAAYRRPSTLKVIGDRDAGEDPCLQLFNALRSRDAAGRKTTF